MGDTLSTLFHVQDLTIQLRSHRRRGRGVQKNVKHDIYTQIDILSHLSSCNMFSYLDREVPSSVCKDNGGPGGGGGEGDQEPSISSNILFIDQVAAQQKTSATATLETRPEEEVEEEVSEKLFTILR